MFIYLGFEMSNGEGKDSTDKNDSIIISNAYSAVIANIDEKTTQHGGC